MGAPASTTTEVVTVPPPSPSPSAPSTSPVAVVWCRQVDNEAESPGYTTVPEEFPGARETLDTIRIVGNLTINIADTHDYWDPDPAQPLSYYPNLFLYPANNGRYTCVGRMFLSTEDRPRLGMKTVVLDTAQLLANHEFGTTVVRWHASMGGARPGARLPPIPDASLYPVVGEGFLFQRGTTDPVVLVASEQWEPATQAVLDLVRLMPASLVAPAAFLCFPYFLPAAKTDLKELTEQLPLALALMRIARGEAAGDRHAKRIAAWEAVCSVRDLTDGVPTPTARGKESVPLVLSYVRDREESKIRPIAQRVDLVELPKVRTRMADPERAGGKDRRKEMWRIGTAMESAALLLSKSRGRHVPVSAETAKRAQEYLDARLPAGADDGLLAPAGVVAASGAEASPSAPHHPPWLQRNESVAPIRVDRVEVVPVSHSDDPSLLPPAPKPADAAPGATAPSAVPDGAAPSFRPGMAPVPVDVVALKAELERNVAKWVEGRLAQFVPPAPPRDAFAEEIDRRAGKLLDERLAARPEAVAAGDLAGLESRLTQRLEARELAADADVKALAARQAGADNQLAEVLGHVGGLEGRLSSVDLRVDDVDGRLRAVPPPTSDDRIGLAVAAAVQPLLDRIATLERRPAEPADAAARANERIGLEVSRQLDAVAASRFGELQKRLEEGARGSSEVASLRVQELITRSTDRMRLEISAAEEDLRQGLRAQLELHLKEAGDRWLNDVSRLEGRLDDSVQRRSKEDEARRSARSSADEARLLASVDARIKELEARLPETLAAPGARLPTLLDSRSADLDARLSARNAEIDRKLESRHAEIETRLATRQESHNAEHREAQAAAAAELQVRLQAYFDQRLREALDHQRDTSLEVMARLKSEVDAGLARVAETLPVQQAIRAQFTKLTEAERGEQERAADERVRASETRLRNDFLASLHRLESLEQTLEDRGKELRDVETSVRADIAELDRRTAILSDRLVPVIRKTWTRLEELERAGQTGGSSADLGQLRRELQRDLHRLENEIAARETALRERMESAIANQGRVWLTLIRQLSDLRPDRRQSLPSLPADPAEERPRGRRGDDEEAGSAGEALDGLPELLRNRRRTGTLPPLPEEEDEGEDPAPRRRRPRSGSRAGMG